MEKQTSLEKEKTKHELLLSLFSNLKMYDKVITHFGDVDSKIMIIGEAPVQSHMESESMSCFKFDVDLNQKDKSGSVLLKVFDGLDISIQDLFWDNIYKIPIEKVYDKQFFHNIIEAEINLINPKKIICLGTNTYNVITGLNDINVNIEIVKMQHPAYVLRGGINIIEYITKFRDALKWK